MNLKSSVYILIGVFWVSSCFATSSLSSTSVSSVLLPKAEKTHMFFSVVPDGLTEKQSTYTKTAQTTENNLLFSFSTRKNIHKWLGYGTLVLAGLTVLNKPDDDDDDDDKSKQKTKTSATNSTHQTFGTLTALAAGGSAGTGLVFNWKDLDFSYGVMDRDNLHAILGSIGALAMILAVSIAPSSSHSSLGLLAGLAMGLGVTVQYVME